MNETRKEILVLGDSHSEIFRRPMWLSETTGYIWDVKKIVGATLLGLKNPQSKTQSKIIFERSIANNYPDAIVCLLGEVDCGFLIWKHVKDQNKKIDFLIEKALINYEELIKKCESKAPTFVISVPLPCVGDYSKYPDHDLRKDIDVDIYERTKLTLHFNKKLKVICDSLDVEFVDLDDLIIDQNGLIKEKFVKKNVLDHHYRVAPYKNILLERLVPSLEEKIPDKVKEEFNAETIIMTRFGINVINDDWYLNQLLIFEMLTYRSLFNQTDTDFNWIVIVDEKAPSKVKNKLAELLSKTPCRSFLVVLDYDAPMRVKMGSQEWVYEEAIKKIKIGNIISDPNDFVITGMIDADDAWHKDTIKIVKGNFKSSFENSPEKSIKSFINSVSEGMLLTFKNGCKLHLDGLKALANNSIYQSMSVFLCARFISGISCFSSRHKAWDSFARNLNFKKIIISTDVPMWIYTVQPQQMIFENNRKINTDLNLNLNLNFQDYGLDTEYIANLCDINPVAVDAKASQKNSFYLKSKSFLKYYSDFRD